MNFVKYVLMLAMLAGFAAEASAQYTVRGKITDKAGEPLAGAGGDRPRPSRSGVPSQGPTETMSLKSTTIPTIQ